MEILDIVMMAKVARISSKIPSREHGTVAGHQAQNTKKLLVYMDPSPAAVRVLGEVKEQPSGYV